MDEKLKHGPTRPGESHELASLFARWAAYFIDYFLLVVIGVLMIFAMGLAFGDSSRSIWQAIGLGIPVVYHWYFWTRRNGQTPGKFALGIRVIKADGTPINNTDAVIRAIGYNVSWIFFGLGYIWAIFDKDKQAWHDKMARTYVVRKDGQRHTVDV